MIQIHKVDNSECSIGGTILGVTEREIKALAAEYVTYYDHLEYFPSRIMGQYALGTATAELTHVDQGKGRHTYFLRLKFKDLCDGQELYTLIRSGKILPTVSYEEKQIDTPVRQLRDLIRELWRSILIGIRSRMAA